MIANPIQTKRIEYADKRRGNAVRYFSMSSTGRISWADWFYRRTKS